MTGFNPWDQFGGWDHVLPVCVDDVVWRWWRILSREEPWRDMPRDDAHGNMRRILSEVLNQARDPDDIARVRCLVSAAGNHGMFRRAQGCGPEDIGCEFGLVLDALDAALGHLGMSVPLVRDALAAVDPDLDRAQRAALRGWHRGATGVSHTQDDRLDRVIDEIE